MDAHADQDALVARAANDRGEDGARGVVAGEAGLAHAGAVVDHEGLDFIVSHCVVGVGVGELSARRQRLISPKHKSVPRLDEEEEYRH